MDLPASLSVIVAVVLGTWLAGVTILWLHRPSRELAGPALRLLPDTLRLIKRLLADPETPRGPRLGLLFLGGFLVFPLDLVPDFVPGVGQLDDVIVAIIVLRWVGRRIGVERLREQWPGTPESFALLTRLLAGPGSSGATPRM